MRSHFLLYCSVPNRKHPDCSERMQKNGRRDRWSCGEGVRSNLKGLILKRIDARSNVNDSVKAVVLCEYVIHVVWISVLLLVITPSVQYETKWVSERSVWMLRSDALLRYSFFYSGDNDYRNSVVSFCNTALLLISDFFSTPLAKQKEAWYNMTRRTEMVIWMVDELGFYRLWNRTTSQGASLVAATVRGLILTVSYKEQIGELYPQVLEALVYGACRELFE